MVQVNVRDNNVENAIKTLKRKLQKENLFKEVKQRKQFEKPSRKRKRKLEENRKRGRKKNQFFDFSVNTASSNSTNNSSN